MTVKQIIKDYLVKNGFDGLYKDGDETNSPCHCFINPCSSLTTCCKPGIIDSKQSSFHNKIVAKNDIGPKKG